jgi:membrane magnesium transporter 1
MSSRHVLALIEVSDSVYSSYEHSLLPSSALPTPSSSIIPSILDPKISIPTDIVLETLFSVLLLCIGVVLGSPDLQPIQWNVWAGKLERSKEARTVSAVGVGGGNPFAALEERPGFLDIRKTRDEFAALKTHGAVGGKS